MRGLVDLINKRPTPWTVIQNHDRQGEYIAVQDATGRLVLTAAAMPFEQALVFYSMIVDMVNGIGKRLEGKTFTPEEIGSAHTQAGVPHLDLADYNIERCKGNILKFTSKVNEGESPDIANLIFKDGYDLYLKLDSKFGTEAVEE